MAVGKSGNPLTQSGVDPRIVIGPGTEIIAGEGKIVTAGGVDTHIHFICPQQIEVAIASGVTTLIGGGTGSATGTWATTCTPGPWNIMRMLQAFEGLPINVGILGKGNGSSRQAAGGTDRGRRMRAETPRRLGHHARRHRHEPDRGRQVRYPDRHPHRYAQRMRVSRRHDRAPSKVARSTASTPRGPAAVTRRTSSRSPASPTSCPPAQTQPGRSPSTRLTSTSTC